MRFLCCLFFMIAITLVSAKTVKVNGYYRSNGTYVEGYLRSSPNATVNDNCYDKNYPDVKPKKEKEDNSSDDDNTWVEGYYRSDGTYVQGHYRRTR